MMQITTIIEEIIEAGIAHPKAVALDEPSGRTMTYDGFSKAVNAVSSGLVASGLKSGDEVLFAVRPGIESMVLAFSIVRVGGVIVVFDPTMGASLFAARMESLKPKWAIAESVIFAVGASAPLRKLMARRGVRIPNIARLPDCRFIRVGRHWPGVPQSISYASLAQTSPQPLAAPRDSSAPVAIAFTSGTTGNPKAVVHANGSSGASGQIAAELLALKPGDAMLCDQLQLVLPTLRAHGRVVFPRRDTFDPAVFLDDLERRSITCAFGLPSEYQSLIEYCQREGRTIPPTLRTILLGAAPVYRSLLSTLRDIIPATTNVWAIYTMTEMLPVAYVSLQEELASSDEGDLVGRLCRGATARLAPDGELLVKGPNLFSGYLHEPDLDEHATGDLARFDSEGRVVLLGRKKDMIIRRHENIYPALFEPTISGIEGVRSCSMVGVYDDKIEDESSYWRRNRRLASATRSLSAACAAN